MNPQQDNQGDMDAPQPDATLSHNDTDTDMTVPSQPSQDTPGSDDQTNTSAPAVDTTDDNDTAGDYIMTDPPQTTPPSSTPTDQVSTDDLLDLKQDALQQLTPLLGHLEQSPDEKFRTTMMMIQASDNQGLLKVAYEAAQQITDEKMRAQALLDVVNEINYFTQHNANPGEQPEAHDQDSL